MTYKRTVILTKHLAAIVVLCTATTAYAQTAAFQISGQVIDILPDPPGDFEIFSAVDSELPVGTAFSGVLQYDLSTSDINPNPNIGTYTDPSARLDLAFQSTFGTTGFAADSSGLAFGVSPEGGLTGLGSDDFIAAAFDVLISFDSDSPLPVPANLALFEFDRLEAFYSSGEIASALASDSLPSDLSGFTTGEPGNGGVIIIEGEYTFGGRVQLVAAIESVIPVPEPSSALLLGLAVAPLFRVTRLSFTGI